MARHRRGRLGGGRRRRRQQPAGLGDPATAGLGAFGGVLSTPYIWVFITILVTLTIGALLGVASAKITAAITPKERTAV